MKILSMSNGQNVRAILLLEEVKKIIQADCKKGKDEKVLLFCGHTNCECYQLCYNIYELEKYVASKIK